jgi:hypothetical protein
MRSKRSGISSNEKGRELTVKIQKKKYVLVAEEGSSTKSFLC